MVLLYYLVLTIIGTGMVIAAMRQRKKDGDYSSRSIVLLTAGIVFIVCSFFEKVPEFLRAINSIWSH